MDRISGANFVLNGAGKRTWRDRNQAAGIVGTFGNALFFNGVQESIIQAVEQAGLAPTDADNTQLMQAIGLLTQAYLFIQGGGVAGASGSWTVPPYKYTANVMAIGGGGGGGPGGGGAGGGGCSGGFVLRQLAVEPGQVITWIAGNSGGAGGAGGSSAIGGISAGGGNAGGSGTPSGLSAVVSGSASATGGQLSIGGGAGQLGDATTALWRSGYGAGSTLGNGAVGVFGGTSASSAGVSTSVPGAGGSGGTGGNAGGSGGYGLVAMWG